MDDFTQSHSLRWYETGLMRGIIDESNGALVSGGHMQLHSSCIIVLVVLANYYCYMPSTAIKLPISSLN